MARNVYEPAATETPSAAPPDWGGLWQTRILALSAIPVWLIGSTLGGTVAEVSFYIGTLMFVSGVVAASSIRCPACGERFMRLRVIEYFYGFWLFKILFMPHCRCCGAGPGQRAA